MKKSTKWIVTAIAAALVGSVSYKVIAAKSGTKQVPFQIKDLRPSVTVYPLKLSDPTNTSGWPSSIPKGGMLSGSAMIPLSGSASISYTHPIWIPENEPPYGKKVMAGCKFNFVVVGGVIVTVQSTRIVEADICKGEVISGNIVALSVS